MGFTATPAMSRSASATLTIPRSRSAAPLMTVVVAVDEPAASSTFVAVMTTGDSAVVSGACCAASRDAPRTSVARATAARAMRGGAGVGATGVAGMGGFIRGRVVGSGAAPAERDERRRADGGVPGDDERPFVDALEDVAAHDVGRCPGRGDAAVVEEHHAV